jgi:hypothetical protein
LTKTWEYASSFFSLAKCLATTPKRLGSTPIMSTVGSPSTIQLASCQPAPPAAVTPKLWPSETQKLGRPKAGPTIGLPSGV